MEATYTAALYEGDSKGYNTSYTPHATLKGFHPLHNIVRVCEGEKIERIVNRLLVRDFDTVQTPFSRGIHMDREIDTDRTPTIVSPKTALYIGRFQPFHKGH